MPALKWTLETCKEEALKYSTRREFKKVCGSAYETARIKGWLDEICKHMTTNPYKPRGYWTLETCKEEALKYSSRSEFAERCYNGCKKARKEGWLDEICGHMELGCKPRGYWTLETCKEEALKYSSTNEFAKRCSSAYNKARIKGWLDEICKHMTTTRKPRGYWTLETCKEEALKYSSRNDFVKGCGSAYDKALKEGWLEEIFKHITPDKKHGGYWTLETCKEAALSYSSRSEFAKGCGGGQKKARKEGWLDEICGHMELGCKPGEYWTLEICKEEALKYSSRSEFAKGCSSAYNKARKEGWLDEVCMHMI